jgi:glutamate-1-semialdehyde 2,1-aminomutase
LDHALNSHERKDRNLMKTWNKSREMLERAKQSLVGGVSSPFRAKCKVPLYFADAAGSRMRDVDGNEYIDYGLAWGPLILGHCHPVLTSAMEERARKPHNYGAQHEIEYLVAELMQKAAPGVERVAFTSSGSEALQCAMRLARAATGRHRILKFEGHYHGWMDSALLSYKPSSAQVGPEDSPAVVPGSRGQVPNAVENAVVARWNRLDMLEHLLAAHSSEIAAVLMEPVLCNSGCLMPLPGYLEAVRDLCTRHGVLLIFDEVITGFRIDLGGAQAHFGVMADIVTYGKALAGGLPMSAIAGRADIMEQMLSGTAFGGTFNGNPISTGAALATLTELAKDDGELLRHANRMGSQLMTGLCETARKHSVPAVVTGFGTAFALHFTKRTELSEYRDTFDDDREKLDRFLSGALEEGLNLLPDGRFYVSAAHSEKDVAETLQIFDRVFDGLS